MPPKKKKDDDSDDEEQETPDNGRALPEDWKPGMPLPLPKISGDDDSEDDSDDESDKALVRTKFVPAWAADSKALRFLPGSPRPMPTNHAPAAASAGPVVPVPPTGPAFVPQAPTLEGYTPEALPPLPPGPPPGKQQQQQQQQLPPLPPGPPPAHKTEVAYAPAAPPLAMMAPAASPSPRAAAVSAAQPPVLQRALSPARDPSLPPPPPGSPAMGGARQQPPPPPMSLGASSIVQQPPPPPIDRTLSRAGSRYGDMGVPPPPSAVAPPPPPQHAAGNSKAWVIHVDPGSQTPYFYNTDTGESTWTQPVGFQPPPPPPTPTGPPAPERARTLSPAASRRNLHVPASPRLQPQAAPPAMDDAPPPPPPEEQFLESQQYANAQHYDYEMKETDNSVVQFDMQAMLARTDKIVVLADYAEHLNIPKKKTFRKQATVKDLIEHGKEIDEPLVANAEIKKETALQMFKNITGFMGDRATSKHPDLHINKLVRTVLRGVKPLRDEAYCQLLKQLTGNLDMKSRRRGWTLLSMVAGVVPPSPEFFPYLEGYIRQTGKVESDPEIIAHIKYVMFILPKSNSRGARTYAPCEAEIDAVRFCRPMMIRVATLDKKFEDIEIWAQDTVQELQERFEQRRGYRGLPSTRDGESCFGIFQALKEEYKKKEGWGGVPVDIEEFLGGSARVADVICRWFIGLEAKPGQIPVPKFRLVYKAKMTLGHQNAHAMESLSPDALYLYYLNAKSDVIHSAFQLTEEQGIKLAGLQVQYQEGDEEDKRRGGDDGDEETTGSSKKKHKKRFKGDDLEFYVPKPMWKAIGFHRNKKKGKIRDQNNTVKDFVQKIHVARRQNKGMGQLDCIRAYLEFCRGQLLYGSNFYVVEHVVDTEKTEWDKVASKAGGDIVKMLKGLDKKHNAVKGPSHVCMALSELGVFFLGLPKMDTKFMLKPHVISHIQAGADNIYFVGDKPGGARSYFFRTLQARKIERMIQLFQANTSS